MRTLAEMNAKPSQREWNGYTLSDEHAVGRVGVKAHGRQMRPGEKYHLLHIARIVTAPADAASKGWVTSGWFNAYSSCKGGVGTVIEGLDTDAITCRKCTPQ